MAKNEKKQHKLLTEEDMKIIKSDPLGLTDYIVYTKIKEVKKTALIVTLVAMAFAFGGGVVCGMELVSRNIPNNTIQVQVGTPTEQTPAPAPEEGK